MSTTRASALADFIQAEISTIVDAWEDYDRSLAPAVARLTSLDLRDHAEPILQAIQQDLRTTQTRAQAVTKSQGLAVRTDGAAHTAVETHALLRATEGFTLEQLVAEYRALRA